MLRPEEATKAPSTCALICMTVWTTRSSGPISSGLEGMRIGQQEVAPQERHVHAGAEVPRRDGLGLVDHERPLEDRLDLFAGALVVQHQVEAEVVGELGVDAVAGEAGAEAVAAVALDGHGAHRDVGGHRARRTRRRCP